MALSNAAPGLFVTDPIEMDDHVLRARRTAALTRSLMGILGLLLALAQPALAPHQALAVVGFAMILASAIVQLAAPRLSWVSVEESLSASAGVLIIGFGSERVSVLSFLWLVAIASGVLARGGRAHWLGRYIVLAALIAPMLRYGQLSVEYAALCLATLGLLLSSGRLTRELNHLLKEARLQADSAEALLLAGDIAARMSERSAPGEPASAQQPGRLTGEEALSACGALTRLIAGEGVSMVVQPIVELRTGAVHAYEALARFGVPSVENSPLHWFSLAEQLGQRPALERTCLRLALDLFDRRPPGTRLSANLSAPVLLDPLTRAMLAQASERHADGLEGLIIEITEETLVHGGGALQGAFAWLREHGARLAVDDMGAGYSGLRQITNVRPSYLKLDRSLLCDIDGDEEREALVGALAGYSRQVGSMLVAEGIETEGEMQVLRRLGVPLVQGYYASRPGQPWPAVSPDVAGSAIGAATATAWPEREPEPAGALHLVA
jgi:EAL domain-containing protein (putative c-di-GMP-specific phosphodiesterase class I)